MKRIVISDTHLGQTGQDGYGQVSLLSAVPEGHELKDAADAKLAAFASAVRDFSDGDPIALCVNGDLLDLSLSTMRDGLESLAHMLEPLENVRRLEYVIGNHDHHMWMLHSEHRRVIEPLEKGMLPDPVPYAATSEDGDPTRWLASFLTKRLGRKIECSIAYPALVLDWDRRSRQPSDPRDRLYATHGHLFGSLYTFVSRILSPFMEDPDLDPRALAVTNLALTEFIYWLLGETGEGMGVDGIVEAIYTDMDKGKESNLRKALASAAGVLFPNGIVSWIPDSWERWFLRKMAGRIAKHLAEGKGQPMTSSARHSSAESNAEEATGWIREFLPREDKGRTRVIFACGHTHVAHRFQVENVWVYNTGSWLYEPSHPDPDTYALFLGEQLYPAFRKIG